MSTKRIGSVSEAMILARLLRKGYKVSIPWSEDCHYDLISDDGNKLMRIQCKTDALEMVQ